MRLPQGLPQRVLIRLRRIHRRRSVPLPWLPRLPFSWLSVSWSTSSRAARPAHGFPLASLMLLALLLAMALGACDSTTGSFTVGPAATETAAAATAVAATATAADVPVSPTAGGYSVKVYFSKHPQSDNNVSAVFAVPRVSPSVAVATYTMQQLIAGPTPSESAAGYYTELHGALSGASSCGGADFQLLPNTHIDAHTGTSSAQQGTWVVKFCRTVSLPGDLSGGRIAAQINASLKQFTTIKQVQILTKDGGCFDDLSGQNYC